MTESFLKEQFKNIETELGDFNIKVSSLSDGFLKIKPELKELLKASFEKGVNQDNLGHKIISEFKNNY